MLCKIVVWMLLKMLYMLLMRFPSSWVWWASLAFLRLHSFFFFCNTYELSFLLFFTNKNVTATWFPLLLLLFTLRHQWHSTEANTNGQGSAYSLGGPSYSIVRVQSVMCMPPEHAAKPEFPLTWLSALANNSAVHFKISCLPTFQHQNKDLNIVVYKTA